MEIYGSVSEAGEFGLNVNVKVKQHSQYAGQVRKNVVVSQKTSAHTIWKKKLT